MEICVQLVLITMFSFFLVLVNDFILYIDFTRNATSNTATNDVKKFGHCHTYNTQYEHILYLMLILYSKLVEKSSLCDGFNTS